MAKTNAICVRSQALARGHGCGSRASSPNSITTPKSVVGNYCLTSLAATWDDTPDLRDRIRRGEHLLMRMDNKTSGPVSDGFIEATTENIRLNSSVLKPILCMMQSNDLQLPPIEGLLGAIEQFYDLSKVSRSTDLVYQESWAIRRLIGKIKKFIYRSFPPQD